MVKIGIKYPKEERLKMATLRILKKNDPNFKKVSVITNVNNIIKDELEKLGNTIIMLDSNINIQNNEILDLLKKLYDFMGNKTEFTMDLTDDDLNFINKIKEVINHA